MTALRLTFIGGRAQVLSEPAPVSRFIKREHADGSIEYVALDYVVSSIEREATPAEVEEWRKGKQ